MKNCDLGLETAAALRRGLGQYFQDLAHIFSIYRPRSWQRSYMNYGKDLQERLACLLNLNSKRASINNDLI